jgi:hypothetical protein
MPPWRLNAKKGKWTMGESLTQSSDKCLPDSWIDRIFNQMQGMYGSRWLTMWQDGQTVTINGRAFDHGLALAKSTWARELAGFQSTPTRISKSLVCCKSMPNPPTLPEFLALCRQQHAEFKALTAPVASPEVCQRRAQELGGAIHRRARRSASGGSMDWMDRPPSRDNQGPWLRLLMACAQDDNQFAVDCLRRHLATGEIVSKQAGDLVNGMAAA